MWKAAVLVTVATLVAVGNAGGVYHIQHVDEVKKKKVKTSVKPDLT